MYNAQTFLLKKIVEHDKNGYSSFGELNSKHFDDISKLLNEFLRETLKELVPMMNDEGPIKVFDDMFIETGKKKRKLVNKI